MSRRRGPALQRSIDALDLLMREQLAIRRHFRDYQLLALRGGEAEEKAAIVGSICDACCLHLQLQYELLYPAARLVPGGDRLLTKLQLAHAGSRDLIARLDELEPLDADFDTSVAALEAHLLPHLDAERQELFPWLRSSMLDLGRLGQEMTAHRRALRADITRLTWPAVACQEEARRAG